MPKIMKMDGQIEESAGSMAADGIAGGSSAQDVADSVGKISPLSDEAGANVVSTTGDTTMNTFSLEELLGIPETPGSFSGDSDEPKQAAWAADHGILDMDALFAAAEEPPPAAATSSSSSVGGAAPVLSGSGETTEMNNNAQDINADEEMPAADAVNDVEFDPMAPPAVTTGEVVEFDPTAVPFFDAKSDHTDENELGADGDRSGGQPDGLLADQALLAAILPPVCEDDEEFEDVEGDSWAPPPGEATTPAAPPTTGDKDNKRKSGPKPPPAPLPAGESRRTPKAKGIVVGTNPSGPSRGPRRAPSGKEIKLVPHPLAPSTNDDNYVDSRRFNLLSFEEFCDLHDRKVYDMCRDAGFDPELRSTQEKTGLVLSKNTPDVAMRQLYAQLSWRAMDDIRERESANTKTRPPATSGEDTEPPKIVTPRPTASVISPTAAMSNNPPSFPGGKGDTLPVPKPSPKQDDARGGPYSKQLQSDTYSSRSTWRLEDRGKDAAAKREAKKQPEVMPISATTGGVSRTTPSGTSTKGGGTSDPDRPTYKKGEKMNGSASSSMEGMYDYDYAPYSKYLNSKKAAKKGLLEKLLGGEGKGGYYDFSAFKGTGSGESSSFNEDFAAKYYEQDGAAGPLSAMAALADASARAAADNSWGAGSDYENYGSSSYSTGGGTLGLSASAAATASALLAGAVGGSSAAAGPDSTSDSSWGAWDPWGPVGRKKGAILAKKGILKGKAAAALKGKWGGGTGSDSDGGGKPMPSGQDLLQASWYYNGQEKSDLISQDLHSGAAQSSGGSGTDQSGKTPRAARRLAADDHGLLDHPYPSGRSSGEHQYEEKGGGKSQPSTASKGTSGDQQHPMYNGSGGKGGGAAKGESGSGKASQSPHGPVLPLPSGLAVPAHSHSEEELMIEREAARARASATEVDPAVVIVKGGRKKGSSPNTDTGASGGAATLLHNSATASGGGGSDREQTGAGAASNSNSASGAPAWRREDKGKAKNMIKGGYLLSLSSASVGGVTGPPKSSSEDWENDRVPRSRAGKDKEPWAGKDKDYWSARKIKGGVAVGSKDDGKKGAPPTGSDHDRDYFSGKDRDRDYNYGGGKDNGGRDRDYYGGGKERDYYGKERERDRDYYGKERDRDSYYGGKAGNYRDLPRDKYYSGKDRDPYKYRGGDDHKGDYYAGKDVGWPGKGSIGDNTKEHIFRGGGGGGRQSFPDPGQAGIAEVMHDAAPQPPGIDQSGADALIAYLDGKIIADE
ncbi:unnamed protein product [Amoebophrya sp. A25]|nr:unnamed protein product [Amoebophrya sp. A25]|eukprot:GSA25T00005285001.1